MKSSRTNLRRPEQYKFWPAQMQEIKKKKSDLNTGFSLNVLGSPHVRTTGTEKQSKKLALGLRKALLQLPVYTSLVIVMKPSSAKI